MSNEQLEDAIQALIDNNKDQTTTLNGTTFRTLNGTTFKINSKGALISESSSYKKKPKKPKEDFNKLLNNLKDQVFNS